MPKDFPGQPGLVPACLHSAQSWFRDELTSRLRCRDCEA